MNTLFCSPWRSRGRVGLRAIALTLVVALAGVGCQVLQPVLAPGSTVLLLLADTSYVVAGSSTTIKVQAQNMDGAIKDGTEVLLTASDGSFEPQKVRIQGGEAVTTYKAGTTVGRVQLSAESGDAKGEATLAVASGPVSVVRVTADRTSLPATGGDVNVTAVVLSPLGLPVEGAPVEFQITNGGLATPPAPYYSDSLGMVKVKVTTAKSTTIRGLSAGTSAEVGITLRQPVTLTVTSSKSTSIKGETVVFAIKIVQGTGTVSGRLVVDFGDGQSADLGTESGSATASHAYATSGGFNVTARFYEPPDNTETRQTIRQTVQDSPIGVPPPSGGGGGGSGADQIDPSLITWVGNENISNWAVTSTITDWSYSNNTVCIYHTKQGYWPLVSIDENPPNIEAQIGFVAKINGKWYGGAYDWMGQGRTCKYEPPENWGKDQIREFPLDASYPGPRSGDEVGLYMSTPASFRIPVRSVNERTNIILVRWP